MAHPPFSPGGDYSGKDHCTAPGAAKLAAKIKAIWMTAGYGSVEVRTETEYRYTGSEYFTSIRSNLVNGLPPREA